jgi:hypothetical protein
MRPSDGSLRPGEILGAFDPAHKKNLPGQAREAGNCLSVNFMEKFVDKIADLLLEFVRQLIGSIAISREFIPVFTEEGPAGSPHCIRNLFYR